MNDRDQQVPDELVGTAELLRQGRPELAADDLESVRRRVRSRASVRRRPNLAVALCLALGLIFSTAGTGLAVSGLSGSTSAVSAQYPDAQAPQVAQQPAPQTQTQTETQTQAPTAEPTQPAEEPEVLGETQEETAPTPTLGDEESNPAPAVAAAEETVVRQVEATSSLPFTGFEAIPVIVAGIALLLAGALLRRRTLPTA
jgi:hypothetical protein